MNKGKKLSIALAILAITITLNAGFIFASGDLKINLGSGNLDFDEASGIPFIDENNRSQVPFRAVLEAAGASVTWNQENMVASASKGGITVDIPIGSKKIYKNGYPILNDTTSRIVNGRTYLPIRIVLETIGYDVMWNASENSVTAYAKDASALLTNAELPVRYDLRALYWVDPVRDQKQSPNCWAFSSLSAIQSMLLRQGEAWTFSPEHMAENTALKRIYPEGGGTDLLAANHFVNWNDPVTEKSYSFGDGKTNAQAEIVKHVQGYKQINAKDFAGIKKAIIDYGPVLSGFYFADSDEKLKDYLNFDTASAFYSGEEECNHSVALVGWDDNYPRDKFVNPPKRNGAFIAKNSYGSDWGNDGYFYISYEDIWSGMNTVCYTSIEPADNYDYIFTTDEFGATSFTTYGENHATYCNVYTTEEDAMSIRAVGIYSMNSKVDYEIYLLRDFESEKSLEQLGEPIASGSLYGEGFSTVVLPEPQLVEGAFSIVIAGTTTDGLFKIPLESPYVGMQNKFNIDDGFGYVSLDKVYWENIEQSQANICLKVYADDATVQTQ